MKRTSIHIGRLAGIDVALHYSWFLIFALLAWSLSKSYFPVKYSGLSGLSYWVMGIIASVLLFCSVLLHEMSHSLTARHFKIEVHSITLFFFGGIAQVKEQKFTARKEFWIAIAGPLFSLSLALMFFLITMANGCIFLKAITNYLFKLNLILALFNMVPAYPLDGGRVFRAILWKKYKSLGKATYIAAEAGKTFALLMIFFGVFGMFMGGYGLWYILLGLFLYTISKASYKQTMIKVVLEKYQVKDFVTKRFKKLNYNLNVMKFNVKDMARFNQETFPVFKGKNLLGVVRAEHLLKAKKLKRSIFVENLTIPISRIKIVKYDMNCYKALELMLRQNMDALPVLDKKGKLVGMLKSVTLAEVIKAESSLA